jgi:YidC/Oxa1 family membrane protein insertase
VRPHAAPPTAATAAPAPTAPAIAAPTALSARVPAGLSAPSSPTPIGSLDPKSYRYRIEFSSYGAGIQTILFSDFWRTARALTAARAHANDPSKPMPPDTERHVLAAATSLYWAGGVTIVPVLAAHSIEVNGVTVDLFGSIWGEVAPGSFATEIVDAAGTPQVRVERIFELKPDSFDLSLRQRVTNLTAAPAKVRWFQYGPSDLPSEPGASIEVRRVHIGHLVGRDRDPDQTYVVTTGQMYEHSSALSIAQRIFEQRNYLWPNDEAKAGGFTPSWIATTSRYFALAVHAPGERVGTGNKGIGDVVDGVTVQSNNAAASPDVRLLTGLLSPPREIAPSATASFDLGVYAGPLDPKVLGGVEPYVALSMQQSIVYLLSSCCSFCTFSWLANFLASFLALIHDYLVFDWALAIIVLVIVVRLLLHPLMKSSQIKMQRFGRMMGELKPELDAIQKRYKDDPKTAQMEQIRLYREKGVNPAGCVGGILPTFLQMPIWIALYAVLYFNFDLRQQPAFFGLFQSIGGWQFLADLSRPDLFITFGTPLNLYFFALDGLNILPILMGFVFFLQQKYMTPPTPNMTPEQEQQQKMMKWMMVLMFPAMLYIAPSGLTLYILTSTCIGIFESRMVKRHIDKYGLADPPKAAKKSSSGLAAKFMEIQKRKEAERQAKMYKERK